VRLAAILPLNLSKVAEPALSFPVIAVARLTGSSVGAGFARRDQALELEPDRRGSRSRNRRASGIPACDELLGVYFNRPLPPEEFMELLPTPANEIACFGKRLTAGSA
jgi:hypothetical protein